uniref:Cytochrome b-c1 complex subunit 8 n=1 Tax=Crotalus horridus TaxID=35024 RepID=A0A0K8RWG8_CROHD
MGKEFGNLMKTRHIVTYYLSPFEQKLFPNISHRILNTWRRFSSSVFRVVPPAVIGPGVQQVPFRGEIYWAHGIVTFGRTAWIR